MFLFFFVDDEEVVDSVYAGSAATMKLGVQIYGRSWGLFLGHLLAQMLSYINLSPKQRLKQSGRKAFVTHLISCFNVAWCKRAYDVKNKSNENLLYGL